MADNDSVFSFLFYFIPVYIYIYSCPACWHRAVLEADIIRRHHFCSGVVGLPCLSCKAATSSENFFAVCTWHRMVCHIQGESNNTESIGVPGHAVCITSTYLSISQDLGLLSPSEVARGTCIIGHSHGSDQCSGIPTDWPQGGLRSAVADRRYHWNWGHRHCHGL